jgi:hypothetical protein
VKKSFNIQELLHCKSKRHGTKPMHPKPLSRAFQRHQENDLKHPNAVDLMTTKQNNLPSFIDRYLTLRSISSLNNSQNSEMKFHENMKLKS